MKKILVMNFFPAFVPPKSGGELRYFNIYKQLSAYYSITLLSPTYAHHKKEIVQHGPHFTEYRIPKEAIHNKLHMTIDREKIGTEISALVCALSAKHPNEYHQAYFDLYRESDMIVHDFPYMLEYDLFFGCDFKPRIYNSHNFETSLVSQIWSGANSDKYKLYLYNLEKRLARGSDIIFATSQIEKESFIREFKLDAEKVKIAPNGINCEDLKYDRKPGRSSKKKALFIGSGHPPNLEAVHFIVHELSPQCPGIEFYIGGTCSDAVNQDKPDNVNLLGRVEEEIKHQLFKEADVAINPMFSGAGTNLKTLEFLSSGIPLVSTGVGVRGLDLVDKVHFVLAEREHFAEKLNATVQDGALTASVSQRGQTYVDDKFSWAAVAKNVRDNLERLEIKKPKRNILLLNNYEVSNPSSGGEVRINRLYSRLSEYYRILLFCLNSESIFKRTDITEHFTEISFPRSPEHRDKQNKMNAKFVLSVTDIVDARMCARNRWLVKALSCVADQAHLVVFSHPYLSPLADILKNRNCIHESHNCETKLKRSLLQGHPDFEGLIQTVEKVEKKSVNMGSFAVSVSDEDHECLYQLMKEKKEIVTIENGVDVEEENLDRNYAQLKAKFNNHPVAAFIGSGHRPNTDALEFVVDHLAPKLNSCYFIVIGTVCEAVCRKMPHNVLLFGRLEETYKDIVLSLADIAINPVCSGSGSNLKIGEYFAKKLPVVTTPFGARGYSIENHKDAIICDKEAFADNILNVLRDEDLRSRLAGNGFFYAKQRLDWRILAKRFADSIKERFSDEDKHRLLVVTYRFTDPPLGGAEVYLYNVLNELVRLGDFHIDIATLNIRNIYNKFHFSCEYSFLEETEDPSPLGNGSVWKFHTDKMGKREQYQNTRILWSTWMKESLESSLRFLKLYSEPILLGGWYFPESVDGRVEIWSSEEALVYMDQAKDIEISAYSPKARNLTILSGNEVIFRRRIKGHTTIEIPNTNAQVLRLIIDPLSIKNDDPRPLGIRVSRIRYQLGTQRKDLSLDYQYRDFLKRKHLDAYVSEMIRVAESRDGEMDALFQKTRGPNSQELSEWLNTHIKTYDIVLGHSVPFQTSVTAAKYAAKHGVSFAVLPHFHFDDKFYHWKSYYEAMQMANIVFSFPKTSIQLFYEKLGINYYDIPGGGIFLEEFHSVRSKKFLQLYNSDMPFVLVLGRKSASKGYRSVIEAVNKINASTKRLNLVLIGRDEDGKALDPTDGIYLGEQPRAVVLGALRKCMAVINMSGSESFGMVILEAWMSEKAVIVNANCPAFAELVEDKVNGRLATKRNLASILREFLDDPDVPKKLGKTGRRQMGDSYFWANIGKSINDELLKVMHSH